LNPADAMLVGTSLLFAAQAAYSTSLMLYAWEDREKHTRNAVPETYEEPSLSFTVLLPARHEEEVIQDTIQRVVDLHYPRELVQVLVVIEAGDTGTIAKVNEKLAFLRALDINHVRLITFDDPPINKPHGLNVGLAHATGDVVTIFDAEDEPHPDILQVVNTVMLRETAPVVQCGVQLMNYDDHWFSALNVLEYFFWFKSRMHYHASVGMVPLGGNTVFVTREKLEQINGWDQYCLTEDADLGIRLSSLGTPVRVLYSDEFVTKEETPPSVSQFIKQRTRWNQGFLQVLGKGEWRKLPRFSQRMLALYTLSSPIIQAFMCLYIPVSFWAMLFVKMPAAAALFTTLPLYMLVVQLAINLVGMYEFAEAHRLKASPLLAVRLTIAYFPYQALLSWGALRAFWRQIRGKRNWEKTKHVGAHRHKAVEPEPAPPVTLPVPVTPIPVIKPLPAPALVIHEFKMISDEETIAS
jgi:glycosyltransferase XagB